MKNLSFAVTPEPAVAAEASEADAISKPNEWLVDFRSGMLTKLTISNTVKPKKV